MFDIRKSQEEKIYDEIMKKSDEKTANEIVYRKNSTAGKESDADWVKSTMYRLENKFDKDTVKQIRMDCQCGHAMDEKLALVDELISLSSNLSELGNLELARSAGLSYADGALYLQFEFCPCPMLATVERLETNTWCQCTTGYSKVLFEKAFECNADVELLKSIKMGDDICLMKITLDKTSW